MSTVNNPPAIVLVLFGIFFFGGILLWTAAPFIDSKEHRENCIAGAVCLWGGCIAGMAIFGALQP